MGIKVIHDNCEFEIEKENFKESINHLERILENGIPVMVEEKNWTDLHFGYRGTDRHLFFSDGNIIDNRLFSRNGSRNRVYAYCFGESNNFQTYQLAISLKESAKLSLPKSWTRKQYNEGTFSPAGPVEWVSHHKGGTSMILLGKKVEEKYKEALDAIRFIEKGFSFVLDSIYSMPGHLVTSIGQSNNDREKKESEYSKVAGLSSVRSLIEKSSRKLFQENIIESPMDILNATQLGYWNSGSEHYRNDGYPVNDSDYLLHEIKYPHNRVAFVKVGKGSCYSNIFVLPYKGFENIVELALSEEFSKKYFPGSSPESY
ncbi:MAG: hypothetical protein WC867_03025 [Candidatus Pacearchaeota archaeon]|jgi:hypothetical protein